MIDLQGLEALDFTQNQAHTAVTNQTDENGRNPLYMWVDFENKTDFTVAQQKPIAKDIFDELQKMGTLENCGGNIGLALRFGAPVSWVEQITDAIFLVVEQIKNGAVPTEG